MLRKVFYLLYGLSILGMFLSGEDLTISLLLFFVFIFSYKPFMELDLSKWLVRFVKHEATGIQKAATVVDKSLNYEKEWSFDYVETVTVELDNKLHTFKYKGNTLHDCIRLTTVENGDLLVLKPGKLFYKTVYFLDGVLESL